MSITAPLSAEILRALFDHTSVAILVANEQGTYVAANSAACKLLRGEADEIVGRGLVDFVDPKEMHRVKKQWQEFLQSGRQCGEFELRCLDGKRQRVRFNATANFFPSLHCSFLAAV